MLTNMTGAQGLATSADIAELEHHEVVRGLVVQKASPSIRHGVAHGYLDGELHPYRGHRRRSRGPGGWWIAPEVTIELAPHEVYQPDLAGWRIERMPELPDTFPVHMAPDWVCEVLSPSTAHRDRGEKMLGYHQARVPYYWILDPWNLIFTALFWRDGSYVTTLVARTGDVVRVEPFEDVELEISAVFGLE